MFLLKTLYGAAACIIILTLSFNPSFGQENSSGETLKDNGVLNFVNNIKRSVVFLGAIEGKINNTAFLRIKGVDEQLNKEIFEELVNKGYLDAEGNISQKFRPYENGFTLKLNNKFTRFEKEIIGTLQQKLRPSFYGTGFLTKVQGIVYLITAKHVIKDKRTDGLKSGELFIFFNSKNGTLSLRSLTRFKEEYNVDWLFHQNPEVDIAMIPFGVDLATDDVRVLSEGLFYPSKEITELFEVFFLSYQPGIEALKKISPIVRGGMVSIINEDKTFYIDGFAFPGNSGSPVFLRFSPLAVDKEGEPYFLNLREGLGIKLVGIMGEYLSYQEVAVSTQTGRARMVFEENTGLSKVWPVDYINEITNSVIFKEQLKKIKDRVQKEAKNN
ncbi:MAG: serine protease [Candidatus Omnitrophota bacterium]